MGVASGYAVFDVAIGERTGDSYPVELLDSPRGQAAATMTLPFDVAPGAAELNSIRALVATPGYAVGRPQIQRAEQARDFGAALFASLFVGDVGTAYVGSRAIAESGGPFLRIRLRLRAPELTLVPWELLYDPTSDAHILLDDRLSLVRLPESAGLVNPLSVKGPLRILGIVVDLGSDPPIEAQAERALLTDALADLQKDGVVDMDWLVNPSWRQLLARLSSRDQFHVVHFIGHGGMDDVTGSGYVVMASDEPSGQSPVPTKVPADDLATLLSGSAGVRIAVINACESGSGSALAGSGGTATQLVEAGVSAVIGMQYKINDDAAREFSRQLYENIARMCPLDQAVAAARKAMDLAVPQTLQWAIPTLHMRVASGVIFERTDTVAPSVRVSELIEEGVSNFHALKWARAGELFDHASRIEPGRADLDVWRALVGVSRDVENQDAVGKLEDALPALDRLIEQRPEDTGLIELRGLARAATSVRAANRDGPPAEADIGRCDAAIADLNRAIKSEPERAGTRIARAECYLALGKTQQAIADLDVATRVVSTSARPYALRAKALALAGERRRAIDDLTRAIAIQPSGPYRSDRSREYAELGDYGRAASDLDFELEQRPSAELYAQRARLHYNRAYHAAGERDFRSAIRDYTSALERDPRNADLFAERARAYYEDARANRGFDSARVAADDYERALAERARARDEDARANRGSDGRATEPLPKDGQLYYRLARSLDLSGELWNLAPSDEPWSLERWRQRRSKSRKWRTDACAAYREAVKLEVTEARRALPIWRRWRL